MVRTPHDDAEVRGAVIVLAAVGAIAMGGVCLGLVLVGWWLHHA